MKPPCRLKRERGKGKKRGRKKGGTGGGGGVGDRAGQERGREVLNVEARKAEKADV